MQASSEQLDEQSRPQVSRKMLPIHCHDLTCLFIVTLECRSSAKRFRPKAVNEKEFLCFKQEPIRSQYDPIKTLNLFFSSLSSNIAFSKSADVLSFFSSVLTFFLNERFLKMYVSSIWRRSGFSKPQLLSFPTFQPG